MSTSKFRVKITAQDRVLVAIDEEAKSFGGDAEVAQAIRDIGAKLAERWGVRNYPAGSAQ